MNFGFFQIHQLRAVAHGVVASAAIALFGFPSAAQGAPLPGPNFSDAYTTFSAPFEFIAIPGSGDLDFKEFRYMITENAKEPAAVLTCQNGTLLSNQNDPDGFGRLMFPPIIPPRTTRNMVTATISVISCSKTPGNDSPVAWVWFEYNGPPVAQAGQLSAPTLSQASKSFSATFNLSVTQGTGSDTAEFKEFRYTKTTTTTPPAAPANCTSGTAVPSNGQISIAATTSVSVIACGKTTGNKSSATTATFTLDKTAPTLVVTGPFASDGSTALLSANNASTIKYKLTFAGADNIPNNSDLAAKITLSPLGVTGTIVVAGSGTTERIVTLNNVTGNGTAVKIAVASGTASDSAGNQAIANSTAKTFVLDNTAPTVSVKGPSVIHAKASRLVTYTVTYAGATNVTLAAGDISLSKPDGGGDALSATIAVAGTGTATRTITLTNFTTPGSNARLGIAIAAGTAADAVGNLAPAPSAAIATINVDTTPPTFTVSGPSQENAKATSSVTYTVIYSGATKAITLSPKDIQVNQTAIAGSLLLPTATIKVIPDPGVGCSKLVPCSVAPDPMKRFVTLSGFKNNGTLGIAIKANSASDLAGNFAAAGTTDSATFNVDTGIPTIAVSDPSLANAKADSSVTYTVAYNGVTDVTLSNASILLIKTGTANASFDVSGTGTSGTVTRTVTLSSFTGNGTIKIAILNGTATDTAGNLSPAPAATKTFMVDTTAPGAPVLPASKTFNTAFTARATKPTAADTSFKELRYATASGTSVTAPADCASGTTLVSGGTIAIPAATTSVSVIACDQAGNKSAPVTATYTVDNVPPTITVSAPSVTEATPATVAVTYIVTYSGADRITLNSTQITRWKTATAWAGLAPTVSMDTAVPPDPMKRIVTLKSFKGTGTLGIKILAGTASDNAGNLAPAPSPAVSATFNVSATTSGTGGSSSTPATITGVSMAFPTGTTIAGTALTFTVTTSKAITVGALPKLPFKIGAVAKSATYASGSGTSTLIFNYMPAPGDNGLVTWAAGSLVDGSLTNTAVEMTRTFTAGTTSRTIDTTLPAAPSVTASQNFTSGLTATIGEGTTIPDAKEFRYALDQVSALNCTTTASTVVISAISSTPRPASLTVSIPGSSSPLRAIICDTSGNASLITSRTYTYVVPTPTPTATISTTPPAAPSVTGTTPTNDTTPTWTWITGGGGNGNYRYKLDSSDLSTGAATTTLASYDPGVALSPGPHTLYVQETNSSGNWSASGSFAITIDTAIPVAPVITSVAGNANVGSTIYYNGLLPAIAGTAENNSTVTVYNGASVLGTATTNGSGAWLFTPSVTAGTYTLTAKATDAALNQSAASNSVTTIIDTTAPTLTSISINSGPHQQHQPARH